jgi:galactokinase
LNPDAFTIIAPGRVNLIGEHTDYNDGLVLPMAIEKGITMKVLRRDNCIAILRTDREAGEVKLDLAVRPFPGRRGWACYLEGVIAGYQSLGWEIPGFELDISADLPSGSGLSSSAALEVAMATVVETLCGKSLPLEQKAQLCQKAEHDFAGVPCGIMDQFAVTFAKAGNALLLDCRNREIRDVPMDDENVSVLIINRGLKHSLVDGEYAKRRAQCESAARLLGVDSLRDVSLADFLAHAAKLPDRERRRARHVITEHERTLVFVEALEKGDWSAAGQAMYGSHESLRCDYEVSCKELDLLVEISRKMEGMIGCRMTGGGFGGCVVALIKKSESQSIMRHFRERYHEFTGIEAAMFITSAAEGVRVIG